MTVTSGDSHRPGTAILRHVVTFGRVLREVGIEVGPGRVVDAVNGLGAVDLARQEDVYFTLEHERRMLEAAGFRVDVLWRSGAFAVTAARK